MTDPRIDTHKASTHQTAHFTQEQITHLKQTATRQARIIGRLYFMAYPESLTPSEAQKKAKQIGAAKGEAKSHTWPLTSVRARITELTDTGILEKTDKTAEGEFGRPETKWKWKAPTTQGDMFKPKPKSNTYDPSYG